MALGTESVLIDGLEKGKVCEMGLHPVMEIFDVGDGVNDATRTENVGIFCKEGWGDDACLVFP